MSGLVHIPLQKDAAEMEHGIAVDEIVDSCEFFQRK
jgi:hypothetical protein